MIPHFGVGGGIRSWRSANGLLVNGDDFIEMFQAGNAFVRADFIRCAIKMITQRGVQNMVEERRFSCAADAGDAGERA